MTTDLDIITEARMLAAESELIYRCAQQLLQRFADNANGYPATPADIAGNYHEPEESKYHPPSNDATHEWGHAPTHKTTSTERAALNLDEARATRDRYIKTLQDARKRLIEPLNISKAWLEGVSVRITDDAAPTNDIWCENHIKYGMKEPRHTRNKVCRFCLEVHADRGDYPNKRLCDIKALKGKINAADLDRCMPKPTPIAKNKRTKRKKAA